MSETSSRLSETQSQKLAQKILEYKNKIHQDIGGECLAKALQLYDKNHGGELWWIGNLSKIGLDFGLHHTYFVREGAENAEQALNQSDNGFAQYPPLTVEEVKFLGGLQDISVIRELVEHRTK